MADPLVVVTAIGAGVAIAQPWAIALYRKHIARARLRLHLAQIVEIGFSNFGPTLTLNTTIVSHNKAAIITGFNVELTRTSDSARHNFEWIALRSPRIPVTSAASKDAWLELPSAFVVRPDAPEKLAVVFSDMESAQAIGHEVQNVRGDLQELKTNAEINTSLVEYSQLEPAHSQEVLPKLIKEYLGRALASNRIDRLKRVLYWNPGEYSLQVGLKVAGRSKAEKASTVFTLNEEHCQSLEKNIYNVLSLPIDTEMNHTARQWSFAYVTLKESTS